MVQRVKNPPAMQETWVWSLGWVELLKKGRAIHSQYSCLIIPWTEEPGSLQSTGSQRVGHNWVPFTFTFKGKAANSMKGIPIMFSTDFSAETLQARKEWQDIFKVMKGENLQQNSTQRGSHSDLTEKWKALQTNKSLETSAPSNQLYGSFKEA